MNAAVGSEYPPEWSVLLRKRHISGDPHLPVRCDSAIPDLSPGRYWPGVTAVGYRLMVCGGHPSGQDIQTYGNQCFYFDTNSTENVDWESMENMPASRGILNLRHRAVRPTLLLGGRKMER